ELGKLGGAVGELHLLDAAGRRREIEARAVEGGAAIDAAQRRQRVEIIDGEPTIIERAVEAVEAERRRRIGREIDMRADMRRGAGGAVMDVVGDPGAGIGCELLGPEL